MAGWDPLQRQERGTERWAGLSVPAGGRGDIPPESLGCCVRGTTVLCPWLSSQDFIQGALVSVAAITNDHKLVGLGR